jgi:catechol 2,3-dioxygenase-like lactoylglutathione lyase family enzyme
MLGEKNAIATVAVKNLDVARKFYEGVLGLKREPSPEPSVAEYKSGSTDVMVYESEFAGTNQATALTWFVDHLEKLVQSLKEKGVKFEHYDMPGTELRGDIHVFGDLKNAWFKDPDGNILSLVSR